jgi:large repetitive protein
MPFDLALYDLVSPYVLRGDTFGQWHAALSVLYVAEHSIAIDDAGIVIRGVGRFSGDVSPYVNPSNMTFGVNAANTEGHPANDPGRRDPWIDIRDAHIDFELSAPRTASQKVANAVTAIGGGGGFANAAAVLAAYDANPADAPPSDYANTEFTLDLMLTTVVLRPPFLLGAKLDPSGILVEDANKKQVKITLPKIKVRLTQGSAASDPLRATLMSLGASGLDDRDDFGVAQLITMDPPYAFIGPSKVVGIGFRSATLDLSDGTTPPDVLSQFGYDDSWTGLYLPELRLYIAPHGAEDLAFDASATNLLIGIGASSGVTGDFELAIVDQGSGPVRVSARFYDAAGRSYAIARSADGKTATVTLPKTTRMTVDIDGGLTPYTSTAKIGAAAEAPGRLFDVDFGSATTLTIVVTSTGAQPSATPTTLTITATLRPTAAAAPAGTAASSDTPAATVETTSITQGGHTVATPPLKLVSQTSTQAIIAVDTDPTTAAQAQWAVGGTARGTSATVTVDCAPGASVDVQAVLPGAPGTGSFTAYYRFDHPRPNVDNPVTYTADPDKTHTTPSTDQGVSSAWPGGSDVLTALTPLLDALPAGAPITIKGYASYETGDSTAPTSNDFVYNKQLALNRAQGLQAIIARYPTKTFTFPSTADDMSAWTSQGDPNRNLFWKAIASWTPVDAPGTTITGTVSRPSPNPPVPVPVPDNPQNAPVPHPPSWFKKIDAKVRIVRDHFVACEVSGKFDIQTPSENQLATGGVPGAQIPTWGDVGSQNPADGIIDVRVVVQIDDATDIVTVSGYFGADPADRDGLKMIGWLPPAPTPLPPVAGFGQNFFGLGIAFWPLIADAAGSVANDGAAVELAVSAAGFAAVGVMASLGWFHVERIVWYGGEIDVQVRPEGTQVLLLVDIETAISAEVSLGSIQILTIPRPTPLTVRYKAIGFLLGNPPGQPKFQFRPFFDSSKGYTIDVSKPGAIQVHDPFDKILKILGARLARNNPFLVELDLGFAIDLGVVSIERARVRLNLNPGGPPELTAFAASVDIPGALRGRGSIEMGNDSHGDFQLAGSLDLTIVPVEVRIAATLQIAQISAANGGPATGVKVTLEVDFPVAIPLGSSGLGIYGFIGLFAVNFARDESKIPPASTANMAPALAWLKATGGDPTNNDYWTPKVNSWAFGVGALLGTEGSDVIFNLKGIFLLELPGPRLLLMMKANLLIQPPELKSPAEGMFLAVLDLDFGRGTLTIGLSIDFNVDPLLRITIPVEAFFDFNHTENWHLYLGQFSSPVHATVLSVFDASGYLMLAGNGIPAHPAGISGTQLPAVTGFSIGAGLHVSFKWGGGPLYAELAAGFDAVVGFSPFRMAGVLGVRGSLHLFIIDISAWAELDVDVGDDGHGGHIAQISGDICGKVDFLFFSISGCVHFSLGGDAVPAPPAPPLVKSLKLVSRSPALIQGTGVDKPIDAALGDAVQGDSQPADLPVVPIDVVPAVMLAMPPLQDAGLAFLGQPIGGTPNAPSDGWVQRGDMFFRYTVHSVELVGPVGPGKTPAVWWNTKAGDQALEAQLALLSWVPDPTPKAVGSSKYLDETTTEKWGTVCQKAAPPAPVLWTFFFQVLGPSDTGWKPLGLALPDPPQTVRSSPPDTWLRVTERWRCGAPLIDHMRGIVPAQVEAAAVGCPQAATPAPAPTPTPTPTPVVHLPPVVTPVTPPPVVHLPPIATAVPPRPLPVLRPQASISAVGLIDAPQRLALDPVTALRGGRAIQTIDPSQTLTVDQAVQKLATGQALTRAALSSLAFAAPAAAAPPTAVAPAPGCFAWALAAPVLDNGNLIAVGGDSMLEATIKQEWSARKFQPGPLDDAVVFDFGGEFDYARFFLWVPVRFLDGVFLTVAASDATDHLSNVHPITAADRVPPHALPATWTDATSPWHIAEFVLAEYAAQTKNYAAVFVEIKGAPGATRVQIGCLPSTRQTRQASTYRPFYVGAIEALKHAETLRSSYDTTEQTKKQGVLDNALGLDSADNALLAAGQTYQVKLTWKAESQQRTPGKDPSPITTLDNQTAAFWFATDSQPPAKLDPWILVALPGEAEKHYFASEPIKVVFATNNVGLLYDAYGKKLQARLRPSSYHPPPSTPAVPHPLPLTPSTVTPVKGAIFSPWEGAVRKLAASSAPCIDASGQTVRHSMLTIPIPLDLYTDYTIDIEMLDKAAADGSPGTLVWRGTFSTGGFRTGAEFATSFQISRVNHRGVHSDDIGKLQAIGALYASQPPQGDQLDTALTGAGLEALPVPKVPAFTVFWEPSTPPQPVAILVDSSEPMWRDRPLPTQITGPGPTAAQWYELQPQPWLELAQQPGGDDIVDRIVTAPGGQRALVTLKSGARGKHILLALQRIAHTEPYLDGPGATDQYLTVLNMNLTAAPWEEVD